MNKSFLLCLLLGFILLIPIILAISSEEKVDKEGLCVDGRNNENLEGMMCDQSYYSVLGLGYESSIIFVTVSVAFSLFGILFLIISMVGLFSR